MLSEMQPRLSPFDQKMDTSILPSIMAAGIGQSDPDRFSRHYFGHPLHTNQKDIVTALTSQYRMTQVIEPRQSGKTSGVAVACAINAEREGTEWNMTHAEPYRIGIFAPKLGQAELDISRIKMWARCTANGRALIDWEQTTNTSV